MRDLASVTDADRQAYAEIAKDLYTIAAKLAALDTGYPKMRAYVVDLAANLARRVERI